jgi:hypothetical protein
LWLQLELDDESELDEDPEPDGLELDEDPDPEEVFSAFTLSDVPA